MYIKKFRPYFNEISTKTITPKTKIKLPFQKEFAFFNSMN